MSLAEIVQIVMCFIVSLCTVIGFKIYTQNFTTIQKVKVAGILIGCFLGALGLHIITKLV